MLRSCRWAKKNQWAFRVHEKLGTVGKNVGMYRAQEDKEIHDSAYIPRISLVSYHFPAASSVTIQIYVPVDGPPTRGSFPDGFKRTICHWYNLHKIS